MFEDVTPQQPPQPPHVEDIFSQNKDVPVPPLTPVSRPAPQVPPAMSGALARLSVDTSLGASKSSHWFLIFGLVAAVVVVGGGVYWWWSSNQPVAVPQPVVTAPASQEAAPTTPTPPPVTAVDTDSDGLPDTQEAVLGTDPKIADTDSDGLFDGEEVNVYHTDPLNPDTDGDGYIDGQEVRNQFNPLGPGKLLQLPTS